MKSKFYLIIFFLFSIVIFSQELTVTELETLSNQDFEQFSLFALSKNYELFKSEEKRISYYHLNKDLLDDSFVLTKDESHKYPLLIYMVSNKNDYLNIIEQLKMKGYYVSQSDNSSIGAGSTYVKSDNKYIATTLIMKEFYKIYIGPTNY